MGPGEPFGVDPTGRGQQQLAGVGHPAADDEDARVQDGGKVGQPLAEPAADLLEAVQRSRVPLPGGLGDLDRLDALGPTPAELEQPLAVAALHIGDLARLVQQRAPGDVLLPAAVLAAAAASAALADLHVTELRPDPPAAAVEVAVEHDAAPDAGADGDHDQVGLAPAGAEAVLRPGRGVGVVLHHDRKPRPGGDRVAQGLVAPGQVGRDQDGGPVGGDEAGRAHADGLDALLPGRFPGAELAHALGDHVLDVARGGRRGRVPGAGQDGAPLVHESRRDLGPADVDADGEHSALPDVDVLHTRSA